MKKINLIRAHMQKLIARPQGVKINIPLLKLCLLALTLVVYSCAKKQVFDINGSDSAKIFLSTYQASNPGGQAKNQVVFSVTQSPIGAVVYDNIALKIPAQITVPAPATTTVSVSVDNSLIDAFNKANNTTYKALPTTIFSLINTMLTINQNSYTSKDSLSFSVDATKMNSVSDLAGYIVPLRITSLQGEQATTISANQNILYVLVNVKYTNIKQGGVAADMAGTIIADRTTWTATSVNVTSTGTYKSMFDGTTTTSSRWGFTTAPVEIILDLQQSTSVTGLRFYPYSTTIPIQTLTVATSTDGVTYTPQGSLTSLPVASSLQYAAFYAPVTARYIKTTMNWNSTTTTYYSLIEYNVYKSN